jgi:transcriptional regulator with XRE-family HTH domain
MSSHTEQPDGDIPSNLNPASDTEAIARLNLRMACTLRGLTMSEAATRAGLGRNALSQYCSGRSNLSYSNMKAICDVLDLPIELVSREDAITAGKIRLRRALDRLSDDDLRKALDSLKDRDLD